MLNVFPVRTGEQIVGKLPWVKMLHMSFQPQTDLSSPDESSPFKVDVETHDFLVKPVASASC